MELAFRLFITLLLLSSIGLLSAVAATATATTRIYEPAGHEMVSGTVEIRGSALLDHPTPLDFEYYRLEYNLVNERTGSVSVVSSSIRTVQVRDGLLATWDTTQMPNGLYLVRLQVYGPRGLIAETTVSVTVSNSLPWLQEFSQKTA